MNVKDGIYFWMQSHSHVYAGNEYPNGKILKQGEKVYIGKCKNSGCSVLVKVMDASQKNHLCTFDTALHEPGCGPLPFYPPTANCVAGYQGKIDLFEIEIKKK